MVGLSVRTDSQKLSNTIGVRSNFRYFGPAINSTHVISAAATVYLLLVNMAKSAGFGL